MQIVQVDVVKRDAELRKGVERGLLGPPVESIAPIVGEVAQITDISAVGPGVTGRLIGKRVRPRRSRKSAMSASGMRRLNGVGLAVMMRLG
jgi:hypothetical protein